MTKILCSFYANLCQMDMVTRYIESIRNKTWFDAGFY